MNLYAEEIIQSAVRNHVILEHNFASVKNGHAYKPEFWELDRKSDVQIISGADAHHVQDIFDFGFYLKKKS